MMSCILSVIAVLSALRADSGTAPAFPHANSVLPSVPQGNPDRKVVIGFWEMQVSVDGVGNNQPPVTVVIQEAGNKLTGKVTVPKVEPTATGLQTTGNKDLALDDVKFNGKKLSFLVVEDGNDLEADLSLKNDNEFEGRWRSEIKGRWKGSKNEFADALVMKRKK
jgi:hypothetical protein